MSCLRYVLVLLILGATGQVTAQGESSRNPALKDYNEVAGFRDALYLLFDKYLPAHNYEALLNAAPVLQTAAIEYSKMKYDTHHNAKHKAFVECRDSLSLLVKAYVDAALQSDSNTVVTLVPPMQEQFEKSTAILIPYSWPEYARVRASAEKLEDLVNREAKSNTGTSNVDISLTVDTVAAQMAVFVASPGPQDIQYRASLIADEKTYFTKLVDQIKTLRVGGEQAKLRTKVGELKVRLVTFERYYLQ